MLYDLHAGDHVEVARFGVTLSELLDGGMSVPEVRKVGVELLVLLRDSDGVLTGVYSDDFPESDSGERLSEKPSPAADIEHSLITEEHLRVLRGSLLLRNLLLVDGLSQKIHPRLVE